MADLEMSQLRVLIANEHKDRHELLPEVVAGLGHQVIASETDVEEVGPLTAKNAPTSPWLGSDSTPATRSS
jgi:hypothetical protein